MNFDSGSFISWAPLITSLVALGTLWNVLRQRIISNRPHLVFDSNFFNIKYNVKDANQWPSVVNEDDPSLNTNLYNIGLGTAQKVEIKWHITEEDIIKLKQFDTKSKYFIEYSGDKNLRLLRIEDSKLGRALTLNLSYDTNQEFGFILPYKSDEKLSRLLEIPKAISYIYGIYSEFYWDDPSDDKLKGIQDQKFYFDVKYQDIAGKSYKQKHSFKVEYISLRNSEASARYEIM